MTGFTAQLRVKSALVAGSEDIEMMVFAGHMGSMMLLAQSITATLTSPTVGGPASARSVHRIKRELPRTRIEVASTISLCSAFLGEDQTTIHCPDARAGAGSAVCGERAFIRSRASACRWRASVWRCISIRRSQASVFAFSSARAAPAVSTSRTRPAIARMALKVPPVEMSDKRNARSGGDLCL